jgi:hypothetical protein
MKRTALLLVLLMLTGSASATVKIIVEDVNGLAAIKYETTEMEPIRAFALDITVDAGTIDAVSGYVVGESTIEKPGYGIFPASFAQVISIDPNTGEVAAWDVNDYTPVAPAEDPGALAGLGAGGITLEMGALYAAEEDAPGLTGTLCLLQISEAATVSVELNIIRGGIVLTDATIAEGPELGSAIIDPQ